MSMLSVHFALVEMRCHDPGRTPVPAELRNNARRLCAQLEVLRSALRAPIVITSGYRTPAWNRHCKGARTSRHVTAEAADIRVRGKGGGWLDPVHVHAAIERLIAGKAMDEGGLGLYQPRPGRAIGWVHYDVRGKRARWAG